MMKQSGALEAATRAIKGMQKNRQHNVEFDFDPDDKEQITTYMQLRQTCARISPQQLANAMKKQTSQVVSVGTLRISYWGVPKGNFPDGLPANIAGSELTNAQVQEMELLGGAKINTDELYIVDCEVQRSILGKGVTSLEFATKSVTKRDKPVLSSNSGTQPGQPLENKDRSEGAANRTPLGRGAEKQGAPIEEKDKDKSEGAADRTHLGRGANATLKRNRSDADESDENDRPGKQLKTMLGTLTTLKESMYRAMDQGLWEATSPLQEDNVKYLLTELIAVLIDMKGFKPAVEVSALASKVARWFISQILNRPVFVHLHVFKDDLIKKLVEGDLVEGIDLTKSQDFCTDMIKLIESLAKVSMDEEATMPDLSCASVANRTTFRSSILYQSFLTAKVDKTLDQAKKATGSARLNAVKSCQHVQGLSAGVQHTISVVITLFDENVPLDRRIPYIVDQQDENDKARVIKLALDWDPDGVVGMAAMCLSEKADLTGKQYLVFEEFAQAAIKTVGGNNIIFALLVLRRLTAANSI